MLINIVQYIQVNGLPYLSRNDGSNRYLVRRPGPPRILILTNALGGNMITGCRLSRSRDEEGGQGENEKRSSSRTLASTNEIKVYLCFWTVKICATSKEKEKMEPT
jgi:hypothetical protein